MVLSFQFLGLLICFFILIFYYMGCDKYRKKDMTFKYLLLATYLSQLTFVCTYIMNRLGNSYIFYTKLYLIFVLLIYSGLIVYYISFWIKDKYKDKIQLIDSKLNKLKWGLLGINVVSALFIMFSKVTIVLDLINYKQSVFMIFAFIYLILGGISLFFVGNKTDKSLHLWFIYLVSISGFVLQNCFGTLGSINSSLIFIILYLYVTLENLDIKELEVLKLQRDYNAKQNIDKVAFLKNISHEVRIPLNTIDGFGQIILDSEDMNEIKNDVKDIRVATRDLMDVINGMIDLSIIESGNLEIIYENYNVYDMFDNITDIVNSKLRGKEVFFDIRIAKDIPEVLYGDSERISQVILNILKNSIKYTDRGTIKFLVECVRSKSKCRLKIIVEDTGKGMTDDEIQSIFVENNDGESKGIGLLVSKYLISLMNGSLEVNSTYKEGTTIVVTLDQKIISEKQEVREDSKKNLKPFKVSGKRILIVDDNKLNLKVASKLLKPYDIDVIEVTSGKECLDLLDNDKNFDLILMDDLMPEMSGTETLDILKKLERIDGYYIPIVVVTANAVSGQREKYLEMGFDDYLSKPIERDELDRVLRKYLKGKK